MTTSVSWRRIETSGFNSEDLDELAAKPNSHQGNRAAKKSPGPGVELADTLAYLAQHLDADELATLQARAAGEPVDKGALARARHKAKRAMLRAR